MVSTPSAEGTARACTTSIASCGSVASSDLLAIASTPGRALANCVIPPSPAVAPMVAADGSSGMSRNVDALRSTSWIRGGTSRPPLGSAWKSSGGGGAPTSLDEDETSTAKAECGCVLRKEVDLPSAEWPPLSLVGLAVNGGKKGNQHDIVGTSDSSRGWQSSKAGFATAPSLPTNRAHSTCMPNTRSVPINPNTAALWSSTALSATGSS
eukprot:scaffold96075_cov31-Tisochrysis_lutea.AAC.3